jgi:hypothetical protein
MYLRPEAQLHDIHWVYPTLVCTKLDHFDTEQFDDHVLSICAGEMRERDTVWKQIDISPYGIKSCSYGPDTSRGESSRKGVKRNRGNA